MNDGIYAIIGLVAIYTIVHGLILANSLVLKQEKTYDKVVVIAMTVIVTLLVLWIMYG